MNIAKVGSVLTVLALAGAAGAAEWLGTGGDTLWNNAGNWNSKTGVPVGNIAFSSQAGDYKTVSLDGTNSFSGTFAVSAGTADAPFVFTAEDRTDGLTNSLTQTNTSGLSITGALKVEKGNWNFANDIVPNGGYLQVSGGRLTTQFWMPVSGNSTIVVDGGELVTGYRDGTETSNGRLNLGTTANKTVTLTQNGGRIRCANNTNGGNDAEALTLGEASGTTVTVNLNGGELVANGKVHIGYGSTTKAELNVNGGTLTTTHDIQIGRNGSGVLTINGGAVNCGTKSTTRWVYLGNNSSTTAGGTLNLNGGVLTAGSVRNGSGTAASTINLNGGILRANATTTLIEKNDHITVAVGVQGAIIDTDAYTSTINQSLVSGVQEGETDGGLVKLGMGTLWLKGETTYTGATVVSNGVLGVRAGHEFHGPLSLGEHATLAVDYDYSEEANLAMGDTIDLFKATELDLAEGDSLATTVVLTGAVIGYTIEQGEDGWVKARVTDVTNITSTRKVTVFLADNDLSNVSGVRYVDQDTAWDNKAPSANSFDVAVFPQDAMMCVYWTGKVFNNRAFGEVILRHARLTWTPNAVQWPSLYVNHVGGVGALCLGRSGLSARANSALTVDAGVTIEANNAAVASNDNGWITTESGATATVNGNVVATNGVLRVIGSSITINGDVTIGAYAGGTGDTDVDFTINGTWTIKDGANFKFDDKTVTMGENAKLVLEGTGKISGVSGVVFPTIVLGEGASHLFSELNKSGGNLELDGGTLKMAYNQLEGTGTNLVLEAGQLTLDMSGVSDVSEGTAATIPGVSLASGVSLTDVTIEGSNSSFAWMASLNDDGTIKLTAKSPDGVNRWIGGTSGNWKDGANWQYGVPANGATAQIDNDVTIYFDANKTVSNIVVNANVQFRKSSGDPTINIREVNGTGTIGLYHCGFNANGLPGTIASTVTLRFDSTESSGSDSWLQGSSSAPLLIYAPLTGAGYARIYGNTRFYGNNENFTGKMRKDDVDARFMTPESGLPNATEFICNGTLWLWFDEGTITFPKTTMTASGNRGINMPSGAATSEKGVTLVVGNNDGAVAMSGSNVYHAYTQNGSGWTKGCSNFTLRKVGTGSFTCYFEEAGTLALEGGTTTFNCDCTATTITVTNATIATTADRTIGTVTFGEGAALALNTNALITVQNATLDVSNLTVTVPDDAVAAALAASDYAGATSFTLLNCANSGTVSGTPSGTLTCADTDYAWKALVKDGSLVFARKYVKPGLYIRIR